MVRHTSHRWLLSLSLIFLAEVLLFSLRFDVASYPIDGLVGQWLRRSGEFVSIGAVFAATLGLLVFFKLRGPRLSLPPDSQSTGGRWLLLFAHACFLAPFMAISNSVYSGSLETSIGDTPSTLLWAGFGAAAMLLLARSAAPFRAWLSAIGRARWQIAVSAAVAVACWAGGWVVRGWSPELSRPTFSVARWLLSLAYSNTVATPAKHVLGTTRFQVTIAPVCSGYEGIGLVFVFLAAFLWLFRDQLRFPHVFLLLPIGCLTSWLVNCLRIVLLIAVGHAYSEDLAVGGFHSKAGWLAFNAVAIGLAVSALKLPFFAKSRAPHQHRAEGRATAAYLLPLVTLLIGTMLTGLVPPGAGWWYPAQIVVVCAVLWRYRHDYAGDRWSWSWSSVAIGLLAFVIWSWLEPAGGGGSEAVALGPRPPGTFWAAACLGWRVLGSVIVVPLVEEFAFRGYLMRRIIALDFQAVQFDRPPWTALAISSAAFGLLHTHWTGGIVAGFLYGLAFYRRRHLSDAVLAHVVTNGLIALAVLQTADW